jgi:hypothetical protein
MSSSNDGGRVDGGEDDDVPDYEYQEVCTMHAAMESVNVHASMDGSRICCMHPFIDLFLCVVVCRST